MSWQVTEVFRDYSNSRGAIRTVGFVFASYASADGGGVYPGLATIARQAKVSKKTAIRARRWFVANGEAIITGTKPSHTGTPTPVLDFGPLLLKSKGGASSPSKGDETSPSSSEGGTQGPARGNPGHPPRVNSVPLEGVESTPEPEGNANTKSENETEDARGGARDSGSGLSPSATGSHRTPAQLAAEREQDERDLALLEKQLPTSPWQDGTRKQIEELRIRLGQGVAA